MYLHTTPTAYAISGLAGMMHKGLSRVSHQFDGVATGGPIVVHPEEPGIPSVY